MFRRAVTALWIAVVPAALAGTDCGTADCPPPVASDPARVVSMNLCADVLLLTLAPPERIASVSFLALDPTYSPVVEIAQAFPTNQGLAEEILTLEPDLVLAGRYTNRDSVALLRRLGVPVLELDVPRSLAQTRAQIREVAGALNVVETGETLLKAMDARLAELTADDHAPRPLGALFHPNGFTTGRGTLTNELMELAGIRNLAAREGLAGWGFLTLEDLLLGRPDLVIFAEGGEQAPALARMLARHPAIRSLPDLTVVSVPEADWACAGPWVLNAVERLAQARRLWQTGSEAGSRVH